MGLFFLQHPFVGFAEFFQLVPQPVGMFYVDTKILAAVDNENRRFELVEIMNRRAGTQVVLVGADRLF